MRIITGVFITLLLWGCATDEHGQLITHEDVTWIQEGFTTREQVIKKFGFPRFEGPILFTSNPPTLTTTFERKLQDTTTVQVNEPLRQTEAIYPYTMVRSLTPFYVRVYTSQLWLLYDEKGVVQGYGLIGDAPAM
jgi:hypothetical protein